MEEKEPVRITGEHEDGTEWRLDLIDTEVTGFCDEADEEAKAHWLEVELTIGARWGDHMTMCFDGEKKDSFACDPTAAIRDFSKFVDSCIEIREKMIDAAVRYQQSEN